MPRYIDADKLNAKLMDEYYGMISDESMKIYKIMQMLDNAPTADVREVKYAKNLQSRFKWTFECSHCHWCDDDTYCCDSSEFKFCPNCGAKIDLEDDK
nr:MAG TPA: Nin one binding (NOB1) Zn-ribbon like [Caudoviricetes sp.]